MWADKTAAEMDKQLNQCDASELLRTEAILVLRLIMRARGDCVSRSIPRDQETTRSGDENGLVPDPDGQRKRQLSCEKGVKRNIVALDKFLALFPYTYIGQKPVEEILRAALTLFKSWTRFETEKSHQGPRRLIQTR